MPYDIVRHFFLEGLNKKLSTDFSKNEKSVCYTGVNRSEWSQPDKLRNNYYHGSKKESEEESSEEEESIVSKTPRRSPGCFIFYHAILRVRNNARKNCQNQI
jgi:hypothetical protein